ncbi:MAG: hypothetical protein ABR969_05960, partial [Sedimentisphaerales bacterium]
VFANMARQLSISALSRKVLLLIAIPLLLSFVMTTITPDLLAALILLIYFMCIFQTKYPNNKFNGVLCGFWGGIAYLSKSYNLPFFICHFTLMNFLYLFKYPSKEERVKVITNFFCGFMVFSIICSIWIITISRKYHKITYSTAGSYNIALIGPNAISPFSQGLIAPFNSTFLCAGEDPSYITIQQWSPFESSDAFKYYIGYVIKNILKTCEIYGHLSFLCLPILMAGFLIFMQNWRKTISQFQILYPFITIFLFVGGYCLVCVEERYLWVAFILVLILGCYILDKLFQNSFFTTARKVLLYIFFIISFTYTPIILELPRLINIDKDYYIMSQNLKARIHPGDKIASNNYWNKSLYLAYYLKTPYYGIPNCGIPKNNIDEQALSNDLIKYDISYYLVWKNGKLATIRVIKEKDNLSK